MKILHIADLHLGVSFKSLRGYGVGSFVNNNILANVEKAFRYAVENSIDLVLICGDIFNNLYSSFYYSHRLVSKLKILYENNIPVIIIAGNHDAPRVRGYHSPLLILSEMGIKNIYYQEGLPRTPIKLSLDGYKVGILPFPYIPLSDPSSVESKVTRFIEMHLQQMRDIDVRILSAHYDIAGARYSEADPFSNSYYNLLRIPPNALDPESFDYVALGHIHLHQRLRGYENMYYPGSMDRMNFGEVGEDKGFIHVDLEPGETPRTRFIKVSPVKMVVSPKIDVDDTNPSRLIKSYFDELDLEESLIRVNVHVSMAGWRKLREETRYLDKYFLRDRGAVGYRIDPMIMGIAAEVEFDRERFGTRDWMIKMLEKYIDSLKNISLRERKEMKKYVRQLFEES